MLKELIEERKALDFQYRYIQNIRLEALNGHFCLRRQVLENFDELSELVRIICERLSFIEYQIFILKKCKKS